MWKTGHSLIKTKMAEIKAPLAGEMSGHIFFADTFYGFDDALYCGLRLLNIVANGSESLAEMRDKLPQLVNTPELRFDCPDERKFEIVEEVKARLKAAGAKVTTSTACASAPPTAGGCCAPPTPSPCWWRAARAPTRRGSSGSWPTSRPRWRQAASACRTRPRPATTDAVRQTPRDLPVRLCHPDLLEALPPPKRDDRFFFYGTLLDRDVTALVLGRRLPPAAFVPASLPGHARRRVKGASYPIVVRDPRGEVAGAIVGGLSARDVARLAAYEGPRYRIAPLKVRMAGAMTIVSVFEPLRRALSADQRLWELASGSVAHKRAFVARLQAGAQRAPGVFQAVTWIAEQ